MVWMENCIRKLGKLRTNNGLDGTLYYTAKKTGETEWLGWMIVFKSWES